MDWYESLALVLGLVMVLMGLGIPVAFAFFATSAVGMLIFVGGDAGLSQLVTNSAASITHFVFLPVPLFLLMGDLFFHTRIAVRVFDAFDVLLGRVPGRLSYLTVAGGTVFAALSGTSMGNTAMMGSLLVPEMTKRGYKRHLSMGAILGTAGLAILIPPSSLAVLLASLAKVDVGKLLLAGVIPGLVLAMFYALFIYLSVKLDPTAAPQYDPPRIPAMARLRIGLVNLLPMGLVVFGVIGTMVLGIATPSEAAAFGVLGVLVVAAMFRQLTWTAIWDSLKGTLKVTAMVFLIVMASTTFAQILAISGATAGIVSAVTKVQVAPLVVIAIMFAILLVMGCFMDQVSMMMITVPIFFPLIQSLGYDPIWFGVIMLLTLEIAGITPPFGMGLFVMLGVAPKGTTLGHVSMSALPYVVMDIALAFLLVPLPGIATWLPRALE